MPKSIRTPEQEILIEHLVAMRENQGVTQRGLAADLKVSPSWVAKVEIGERRLDMIEFCWWCQALGLNPAEEAKRVISRMAKLSQRRFRRK